VSGPATGARILVVEDTAYSLHLMTYLLTAYGHTVAGAVTGEQAIDLAPATMPDLVVMDLQLPGMDGFKTMTEIRAIPELRAVPVVAVTSFAMVGDRDRAMDAGFDHYMTKPIDPESFVDEIDLRLPEPLRGARPREPGTPSPPVAAPAPAPKDRPGPTILVLDDSPLNQTLLRSILEPHGYDVRTAATVAEAVESLDADRPDLVLCDFHLGDHSGLELLAYIRGVATLATVPFVFLSATTDWQDPVPGEGTVRFLSRPIEPPVLLDEVQALLPNRKGA
jgi:two-component system, cell cycle response regulator